MDDRMKKMALAGLGLLRLSERESNGFIEKLAAMGKEMLNSEAVPNEPLHFDPPGHQASSQSGSPQVWEDNAVSVGMDENVQSSETESAMISE